MARKNTSRGYDRIHDALASLSHIVVLNTVKNILNGCLIMEFDTKYTEEFRDYLDREGVKPVRCPVRAPNCNPFAERIVRSTKEECLDRMIPYGEASFRRALREYVAHYHTELNHKRVGKQLLEPCATLKSTDGPINCRERLGGMLDYYDREAA
jgi:putative transposase